MAYREFRNEATYEAPNLEFLPQTLAALDTANRLKAVRDQRRATAYDNAKVASLKGGFPQHQKGLDAIVNTAKMGLNEWYRSGRNGKPIEVEDLMLQGTNLANRSSLLYTAAQNKVKEIEDLEKNNPYYKSQIDRQKFTESVYNPELGLDKMDELEKNIVNFQPGGNKLETFNAPKYLDDFVKSFGEKSTGVDSKSKEGIKYGSEYKGKFFDPTTGKPGITTRHVEQVLSTNPDAAEFYTQSVLKDLNEEYKQVLAGRKNDIPDSKEGITLKSLIDSGEHEAAINYMREHPEINPIDQRTEFQRKADKIIPELKDREAVHMKQESDLSGKLPNSSWGIGNKNANEAADGVFNGGPGRVVTIGNTNKMPTIQATIVNKRKNIDTGEVVESRRSNVPMTVNYYSWGALGKDGTPILFDDNDIEATKRKISTLPVDERAALKAAPLMFGTSIDKASVLNLAFSQGKIRELEDQARKNPESDVATDINPLKESLTKMGAGEEYEPQIIQKYFGDVVRNEAIAVEKNDPNDTQYEALTGIRVTDPKSMNPEMKEFKSFIEQTAKEAKQELLQKGKEFKIAVEEKTKQNEEKVTGTKGAIKSTGDDTDTWSQENTYQVGDNIYYFDQTSKQWKRQ